MANNAEEETNENVNHSNVIISDSESNADTSSDKMEPNENENSNEDGEEINATSDLNIGALPDEANDLVSSSALTDRALSLSSSRPSSNRQMNIKIANSKSAKSKLSANGSLLRQPPTTNQITVSWRNLEYTVQQSQLDIGNCFTGENGRSIIKRKKRVILKGVCGHFSTGNLTAVMGPSGSGKSTLLECIVGFRKLGLSGEIKVQSTSEQKIKAALISQTDYLIELFTVREMLVYASRLKNFNKEIAEEAEPLEEVVTISESVDNLNSVDSTSKHNLLANKKVKNYHERLALNVIRQLGLEVCADTRSGSCSGGQKKRISIALEMISKPNILILDEPTSGLDSSACYQTVSVMQRLTRNTRYPIAVVTTIHQPSARVFNLFDQIYIVSYNGNCIYHGSPKDMIDRLSSVDLHCPQFHSPADFIAEVASGEHGAEAVDRLIELKKNDDSMLANQLGNDKSLSQYSDMNRYPLFLHIWILVQRTTLQIVRDPMLNSLRFASHALTAMFIGILYGDAIGKPSLCPPLVSPLNDLENFPKYRREFQSDTVTSTENLAYIFFTSMFVMFGAMMPTIMTFPANLFVLRKEKINGWYSVATYYTALTVAEFPFQVFYPIVFVLISYIMTGQLLEFNRFGLFILTNILLAFISQSMGLMIGAFFMTDASAAVFLGPIATVPIMLFGGFFVRISTIPEYLKYFSYLSFLRYCFDISVIIIYGLDRCKVDPEMLSLNTTEKPAWMEYAQMMLGEGGEKFIDSFARSVGGTYDPSSGKKYQSSLLAQYDINEDYFVLNFIILIVFIVVMRIITYFILSQKINKRD